MAIELFRLRSPVVVQSVLDLKMWLYRLWNYIRGWESVRVVDESTTLALTDYLILVDEASATANITITLPPLASCHTKQYTIRKITEHATHTTFLTAGGTDTLYLNGSGVTAEFTAVGNTIQVLNAEQVWFILS